MGVIEKGDALSFAQSVALQCREELCELIYTKKIHECDFSFMFQTCGYGAITMMCNAIVTVHLAGDDRMLCNMTVLRGILRKTEKLGKIGYLKEFVKAIIDIYNFYAGSEKNRESHPLSPLALVLQSCSLLCIIIIYFIIIIYLLFIFIYFYIYILFILLVIVYICLKSIFITFFMY